MEDITKDLPEQETYYEWIDGSTFVNPKDKPEPPPVALSYGTYELNNKTYPTPIGTYGNFSYIQAPPKSKKSYLGSLLCAVYLAGQIKEGGELKGHKGKRKLLHIDTEQGYFHAHNVFRRISQMANTNGNYLTYALRQIKAADRLGFIDYKLRTVSDIGFVFIDGVADLLSTDVNNQEESNRLVQYLMTWTEKYRCHIMTVIHTNPGVDVKKATGHLGSQLERKCECSIHLEQNQEGTVVKCHRSRNAEFDTFAFKLYRNKPQIIEGYTNYLDY